MGSVFVPKFSFTFSTWAAAYWSTSNAV